MKIFNILDDIRWLVASHVNGGGIADDQWFS